MESAVAKWVRERCDSAGDSVEEHLKRKREMLGRESMKGQGGEGNIQEKQKIVRSPVGKEGSEGLKGMFKEMREEIREGLRVVKQEIREVAEGQKEAMRMEIERMKEDLEKREERWNKKKGEIKEKIKRMERELEGLMVESSVNGGVEEGGVRGRWEGRRKIKGKRGIGGKE